MTSPAFDPVSFVAAHGVVLVSGKGGAPRLSDAVAGEPVRGSWWAHPAGKRIFDALQLVAASPDIGLPSSVRTSTFTSLVCPTAPLIRITSCKLYLLVIY